MPEKTFAPPADAVTPDPRRWVALAVLLLASFMNLIDVTVVNVALPSMQANLGADSSQIEWVVAGYVLAFALGLLPFGRLGDIVGRKRMFLIGVSLFTLCSLLCGIAPDMHTLVAARIAQGLSGSMMTPQVLAIAQVTFPPKEKGLAFSLFGLSSGLASVTGPVLAGGLIGADFFGLDWRPIFLVNVPVGILAVAAGLPLITRIAPHPGLRNDVGGIVLFSIAILLLVYPLIEGRSFGWPLWAFAMIALSIVFMALFYFWERRADAGGRPQLLPASLLGNRNYLVGVVMTMLFFSGIPGFFLVIAIFLQSGFGFSPLLSGLTTMPFSIGVLFASFASGRLGSRWLVHRFAAGALLLALGMAWLRFIISGVSDAVDHWSFLAPLMMSGFGLGIGIAGLFQLILAGVPHKDAGSGSGALQAFQQVGGALGVALVGEIFFSWLDHAGAWGVTSRSAAFVNAATHALIYEIVVFLAAALCVLLLRPVPRQAQGYGSKQVVTEV